MPLLCLLALDVGVVLGGDGGEPIGALADEPGDGLPLDVVTGAGCLDLLDGSSQRGPEACGQMVFVSHAAFAFRMAALSTAPMRSRLSRIDPAGCSPAFLSSRAVTP